MNANHARPLMAFGVLAVTAAVITGVGLRADTRDVTVRAGVPTPVRSSGAPELVLGGELSAQQILGNPFAPDLWSQSSTPDSGAQVSPPSTSGSSSTATKAGSPKSDAGRPATSPTDHTAVSQTVAASTRPRHDPPGQTKTTTTLARPTPTPHGHGKGKGKGSTDLRDPAGTLQRP